MKFRIEKKAKEVDDNTKINKKTGFFMKAIVIYCISFLSIIFIWGMLMLQFTGSNSYQIIQIAGVVFGGELMGCIIKKLAEVYSISFEKSTKKENNKELPITYDFSAGDNIQNEQNNTVELNEFNPFSNSVDTNDDAKGD